ncbi:Uncharacterised protein [Mycobacteroides abscessus subsp. abscessus]|nr:Uncharacterised protein [Mycobacteroides abscessus subsp. abscessus]
MQGCRTLPAARQEQYRKRPEAWTWVQTVDGDVRRSRKSPRATWATTAFSASVGGFKRRCRRPSHRSSTRSTRARSKSLSASASAMRNSASNSGNSSGAALVSAARIAGPLRGTSASLGMQKNVVLLGCAVRAGSPVGGIDLGACFQCDVDVLAGAVWPVHEETHGPF